MKPSGVGAVADPDERDDYIDQHLDQYDMVGHVDIDDYDGGCGEYCPELQQGLEMMQLGRWEAAKGVLFSAATGCQTMQKKD